MQYCILKRVANFIISKYNVNNKIFRKIQGVIIMAIATAVLTFLGGVLPLVATLLKAFM